MVCLVEEYRVRDLSFSFNVVAGRECCFSFVRNPSWKLAEEQVGCDAIDLS